MSKALELNGSDIGGGNRLHVAKARGNVQPDGGGISGDRSGGRDGGGRFGGRRGGRDGGRGRGGGGRGFGNRQSAGTPSAGRIHPVLVKITAFWFEQTLGCTAIPIGHDLQFSNC